MSIAPMDDEDNVKRDHDHAIDSTDAVETENVNEENSWQDQDNQEDVFIEYEVKFPKTETQGFGIYFIKNELNQIIVEGFVREQQPKLSQDNEADELGLGPAEKLGRIQINDVLIHINSVDLQEITFLNAIKILRSAPYGLNTLTFRRQIEASQSTNLFTSLVSKFKRNRTLPIEEQEDEDDVEWRVEWQRFLVQEKHTDTSLETDQKRLLYFHQFYMNEAGAWTDEHDSGHGTKAIQLQLQQEYPYLVLAAKKKMFLLEENEKTIKAGMIWPKASLFQHAVVVESTSSSETSSPIDIDPPPCLAQVLEKTKVEFKWISPLIVRHFTRHFQSLGIYSAEDFVSMMQAHRRCPMKFRILVQSHPAIPRLTDHVLEFMNQACREVVV